MTRKTKSQSIQFILGCVILIFGVTGMISEFLPLPVRLIMYACALILISHAKYNWLFTLFSKKTR